MWQIILKILSVYFFSMLKIIFGPIGGKAAGLHILVTMIATAAGSMTAVFLLIYFGEIFRKSLLSRFSRKKENIQESQKKWKKFIQKFGLSGIAFLTPLLFTPIGGTLLAIALGGSREKILLYMLISICFWSAILTLAVYFGIEAVVDLFNLI